MYSMRFSLRRKIIAIACGAAIIPIVAMFIIGIIGFLLDRIMLVVQNMVSFNKNATA